jgi:hypothetical protein
VSFVELHEGRGTSVDELGSFAAGKVAEGLRPAATTILEGMPRTFSGKANRMLLSTET